MSSERDDLPAPERHGRDLQKVNDRLRELISSLKSDKERRTAEPATAAAGADGGDPADLESRRLASDLAAARETIARANEQRDELRERLAEIEAENRRICDDLVAAQAQSSHLAQLYAALERIHGSVSRPETLAAVQEIVINVVGSEELALFERRGERLALVQSFGIDPEPWREVRADRGALGRAAQGELYVAGREGPPAPGDEDLTACIPLRVADRVLGVLAIFRLLGHKPGLGDADRALFDLLSTHAGLALHLRDVRERALPA
jgi:hypothetical protein